MIRDMNDQLATLTPLPGKRMLLFLSGGFELQPGYAMSTYALGGTSLASFESRNLSPELDALAKRANANEVTFYTVDARGLNAEGGSASNDDPLASRPGVSFIARQGSQDGMALLARETGGLALLNTNDFEGGFTRVYQDASSYYSVGVNLSGLPGTGYRQVRVDVNRPGVTVRARRGYATSAPAERAADVARAALHTNIAYRAFPVSLRVGPATKAKKHYAQPLTVIFPASALTFLPEGEGTKASAEIYIGAIDDRGNTSDINREQATFSLPKDAAPRLSADLSRDPPDAKRELSRRRQRSGRGHRKDGNRQGGRAGGVTRAPSPVERTA